MKKLFKKLDNYYGYDCLSWNTWNVLNKINNVKLFDNFDITRKIVKKSDAILCYNTLNHMPLKDIEEAIRLFKKSESKYLIVGPTNDTIENTMYINCDKFSKYNLGEINLQLYPISLKSKIVYRRGSIFVFEL